MRQVEEPGAEAGEREPVLRVWRRGLRQSPPQLRYAPRGGRSGATWLSRVLGRLRHRV